MSYTPTTWTTGDIITTTKLNNIESGVQSVNNSYTPTTWATGDIITATKLNNIEQGIANAGGGSSDFSTAEVTIIPTSIGQIGFSGEDFDVSKMVRGLIEDDMGNFYLSKNFTFESLTTQEIAVLLPANGWIYASFGSEPTITGNATKDYDGYEWSVTITGDCTITGALNPIA